MQHPRQNPIRTKYQTAASRYVEVDGKYFHYRIEGSGPTLILLHGVMASLHTWDGWVEQLASKYRIIRLDLPGFGLSDPLTSPDHYSPEHSIEMFDKLRAAFGVERFLLAGNSLGGFLSWFYAAHHPDRVEKLILVDPIAYPQALPGVISFASLPGIGEIARHWAPRVLVEQNVRQVYGDPSAITKATVERYYELLMHETNRSSMVAYFRRIRQFAKDVKIAPVVRKIQTPTLLMWGGKDRWVPPALIEKWKRDVKQLEVKVYPSAGHVPMEELPVETARDAHEFFSRGQEQTLESGA
jgi:pimeloyl-ACP methyl ester carboxylesterase